MIDKERAKRIAQDWIDSHAGPLRGEVVVIDEFTIDKPYGWVFFFNRRNFFETHKARDGLAGNGPIIVSNVDGSMQAYGSAKDPREYIQEYEDSLTPRSERRRIGWPAIFAGLLLTICSAVAFVLPYVDPIARQSAFACEATGGILLAMGLAFLANGVGLLPERRGRR